jgi:hypothetical protein
MRVVWKFSVIVLVGVVIQCGLVRSANDIDEAAFVFRMFCAQRAGVPFDDPQLVEDAQRLLARQCKRDGCALPGEIARQRTVVASAQEF